MALSHNNLLFYPSFTALFFLFLSWKIISNDIIYTITSYQFKFTLKVRIRRLDPMFFPFLNRALAEPEQLPILHANHT